MDTSNPHEPSKVDPDQTIRTLTALREGDHAAADRLLPLVYEHLRSIAGAYFRRTTPNQTLQPTALVHEAFLRMVDKPDTDWKDRAHFCAICATAMRGILADHARARLSAKRGGDRDRLTLSAVNSPTTDEIDTLALNEALDQLESLNPRQARLVELRFFGGLSVEEAASQLEISKTSAENDWRMARAWLSAQLSEDSA